MPTRQGIASAFNRHIIFDAKHLTKLVEAIEDSATVASTRKLDEACLPERLGSYVRFIRIGLADKNKVIKATSAKSLAYLARQERSLFQLFESECEVLLQDNNPAVLKEAIPIAFCILSPDNRNSALIDGLVAATDHKNGLIRRAAWDALRIAFEKIKMPPNVAERLIPHLATPDKFSDLGLCYFVADMLSQGLFVDEVKKQAKVGLESGGHTNFCHRKMKHLLAKYKA